MVNLHIINICVIIKNMTEKLSNERELLQQKPSQEIINDPKVLWHAVRGYDFAGLESMLGEGLMPSEDQDYCVCFYFTCKSLVS